LNLSAILVPSGRFSFRSQVLYHSFVYYFITRTRATRLAKRKLPSPFRQVLNMMSRRTRRPISIILVPTPTRLRHIIRIILNHYWLFQALIYSFAPVQLCWWRATVFRHFICCTLGCCEKIKIGIVPSNHKIKLPFDMVFNKIEKCFKNVNVFDCPQGVKVTENKDFSWK